MPFRKFGEGQILPEDQHKTASRDEEWTEEDQRELDQENEDADADG